MSFIYATKFKNTFFMFADTEITFEDNSNHTVLSEPSSNLVKKYGALKTYILSNTYFFAFAGEIKTANDAIARIDGKEFEEAKNTLLNIHRESGEITDFILGYINDGIRIIQIKNGVCEDVDNCYLGNHDAFCFFQEARHRDMMYYMRYNNGACAYEASSVVNIPGATETIDNEYSKLFEAFYHTIYNCGAKGVGGYVTPLTINMKTQTLYRPSYCRCCAVYRGDRGREVSDLLFNTPPQDGSFSVYSYGAADNMICLYFPQGNVGIVYNNARIDAQDCSEYSVPRLSIPITCQLDHMDFYIQTKVRGQIPPDWLDFDPLDVNEIYNRAMFFKSNSNQQLATLYLDEAKHIIESKNLDKEQFARIYSTQ